MAEEKKLSREISQGDSASSGIPQGKKEKEIRLSQKTLAQAGVLVLIFALGGVGGYLMGGHNGLKIGRRDNIVTASTLRGSMMGGNMLGFDDGRAGTGRGMMGDAFRQGLEVTAIDGNKITVKLPSGGTTTITVSDSTVYKTTTTSTKDSVKVGSRINITGTNDSATATEVTIQ